MVLKFDYQNSCTKKVRTDFITRIYNNASLPNPEIEYLDALGLLQSNGAPPLFDSSEIGESSHSEANSSPEAEREYLEALGILEPISQFHQTDIISSGCELLDDHYQ
ncbi:6499_t:CDS:2, partial [Diversispora eburnea]